MPNGVRSVAQSAVVGWEWEVKGRRLGVGGEGSMERGRGEGKREGESEREAELAESWGGKLDRRWWRAGWGGYEGESEGKRGMSERAEK